MFWHFKLVIVSIAYKEKLWQKATILFLNNDSRIIIPIYKWIKMH